MTECFPDIDVLVPGKINVSLRILAREASGYHQIETVFARVDLTDRLTIRSGPPGITLDVTGDAGGALGPDNLVVRAATVFHERIGEPPALRIALAKGIPPGAGLGGGSADAAAVLVELNRAFGSPLTQDDVLELAGALGSDVPFLASGAPVALAWGRGERLLPLALQGSAWALLVLPALHVDTAEAYAELTAEQRAGPGPGIRPFGSALTWEQLAADAVNDFESVVHVRHPELQSLHARLGALGALTARMTGTGAAHFALFQEREAADLVRAHLAAEPDSTRVLVVEVGGGGLRVGG